jgi:histone H3/H4
MASIPKSAIKRLVKKYFKSDITDGGAEALALILEKEAVQISRHAVQNARNQKRDKVTGRDISEYLMKKGFDGN